MRVRAVMPLFGDVEMIATSAKQLVIERIDFDTAEDANWQWHSQLPETAALQAGNLSLAYGATYENGLYGVAIWTRPIAGNRMRRDTEHLLELRRLAIPDYAPKYTATRMLGQMARQIRRNYPQVCTLLSYQMTDVHTGTIYKAANWHIGYQQATHMTWNQPGRPRPPDQSTAPKNRWEYNLRTCDCDTDRRTDPGETHHVAL